MKSFHKFIVFSNNEDPIKTKKGDRRLYIIKSSGDKIDAESYFAKLNSLTEGDEAMKSIHYYFKHLPDVPKVFHVNKFPATMYQEALKEGNRDYLDFWLEDFTERHHSGEKMEMTNNELHDDFKTYCYRSYVKFELNSIQFGKKVALMEIYGLESLKAAKGI